MVDAFICSPHREHLPGCKCDTLGTNLKALEGTIDTLVVHNDKGFVPRDSHRLGLPIVIYCHGNKRNICSCVHMIEAGSS